MQLNSKKALETIGMTKTNNIKSASLSKPIVMYLVKELRKKEIQTIKQDLDRLEKLKEKNKVLLVNKNVAQGIAKKFKEENDKLKKVIEILKSILIVEDFTRENGSHEYYMCRRNVFPVFTMNLTKEQYEQLKEVLGND